MGLTVGLDWASKEHAVCVLDAAGAVRAARLRISAIVISQIAPS